MDSRDFFAVFLLFFFVSTVLLLPISLNAYSYNNDEFFYLLMGKQISRGYLPYRDFFSAHMPVMLYSVGVLFRLFPATIAAGKMIPISSSFLAVVIVVFLGEKFRPGLGALAGILLYLSPLYQLYSHALYGVSLTAFFVMAAVYSHFSRWRGLAGFFSAVAVFCRLNSLPFLFALAYLNRGERSFFKGLVFASPLLIFFAVPNFSGDVILYHLGKRPMAVSHRLVAIESFVRGQWLIIALALLAFRKITYNDRWVQEMALMASAFYIPHILSYSLYDFYLFIGLPILCLLAAQTVYRLRPSSVKFSIIVLLWFGLNANTIYYSYMQSASVDPVVDSVKALAGDGSKVACVSMWCPYMLFKSGVVPSGDLFDLADARLEADRDVMGAKLAEAVSEDNGLVVADLKELTMYRKKFNISVAKAQDILFSNYYPLLYMNSLKDNGGSDKWWASLNQLVMFKPDGTLEPGKSFKRRDMIKHLFYRQRFTRFLKNLSLAYVDTYGSKAGVAGGDLFIPDILMGKNRFNLTLLEPEAIVWPLTAGSKYEVNLTNTYYVTVLPVNGSVLNIFIIAVSGDDIVSFSQLIYDDVFEGYTEVKVYSRLSDQMMTGYVPTYVASSISKQAYQDGIANRTVYRSL